MKSANNNWQPPEHLRASSYQSLEDFFKDNDVEIIGFSEQNKIYIVCKKGQSEQILQGQQDYFQTLFRSGQHANVLPSECQRSQLPLLIRVYDGRSPSEDPIPMSLEIDGPAPDINKFVSAEDEGFEPKITHFLYERGFDYIPLTNKAIVYKDMKGSTLSCSSAGDTQHHELRHWYQAEQWRYLTRTNAFDEWHFAPDVLNEAKDYVLISNAFTNGNAGIGRQLHTYQYAKELRAFNILDQNQNNIPDHEDDAADIERQFQEYRCGIVGEHATDVISRPDYNTFEIRTGLSENFLDGIPLTEKDQLFKLGDKKN